MSGIQSAVRLMRHSSTTSLRSRLYLGSKFESGVSVKKAVVSGTQRMFQTQEIASLVPASPPLDGSVGITSGKFKHGNSEIPWPSSIVNTYKEIQVDSSAASSNAKDRVEQGGISPIFLSSGATAGVTGNIIGGFSLQDSQPSTNRHSTGTDATQDHTYDFVVLGTTAAGHAAVAEIARISEKDKKILFVPHSDDLADESNTGVCPKSREFYDVFWKWRRHLGEWMPLEPDSDSVTVVRGARVESVDSRGQLLQLNDGRRVKYGKLLITHNAKPKLHGGMIRPEVVRNALEARSPRLNTLDGAQDFVALDMISRGVPCVAWGREREGFVVKDITVIGGGFLGLEIATLLSHRGRHHGLRVRHIIDDLALLETHLPGYLESSLEDAVANRVGVDVVGGQRCDSIECREDRVRVTTGPSTQAVREGAGTAMSSSFDTDYVVVISTDVAVDTGLARRGELEVDDIHCGVVVDPTLEAYRNVFVAGDGACCLAGGFGRTHGAVQGASHADASAIVAARNMVGAAEPYHHTPSFHVALKGLARNGSDVHVDGFGVLRNALSTVGVWPCECVEQRDFVGHSGAVYYLRGSQIVGVLLWNAEGACEQALRLLETRVTLAERDNAKKLLGGHFDRANYLVI